MPDESDDVSFDALIGYIQESRGIDFRGYKRTSLRRRITLRMEQVGSEGFAAYHAVLEADPQEFGAACAFLCSAQAGYITGQTLLIDGGAFPGTF